MKASALEFRFRILLHVIIFALGFSAPWNRLLHLDPSGPNAHVWGLLAGNLASAGVGGIGTAFNLLLILGIFCAVVGAALRTWGSAYLGAEIVRDGAMHTASTPPSNNPFAIETAPGIHSSGIVQAPAIIQDGPFRHLRNPLYLGTFLHTLALSLLMPRSGAIFCILAIGLLQVRLILGEEAFLHSQLGSAYAAYCSLVPRLLPTFRAKIQASGVIARWPQAFLGEIYMWLVATSFAYAGWRYNAFLLMQCVVVAFGLSLVLHASMPTPRPHPSAPAG